MATTQKERNSHKKITECKLKNWFQQQILKHTRVEDAGYAVNDLTVIGVADHVVQFIVFLQRPQMAAKIRHSFARVSATFRFSVTAERLMSCT